MMHLVRAQLKYSVPIGAGLTFLQQRGALCDGDKVSFSPKEFRSFKIKEVQDLSPNTKKFEVALPSAEHEMVGGLAINMIQLKT